MELAATTPFPVPSRNSRYSRIDCLLRTMSQESAATPTNKLSLLPVLGKDADQHDELHYSVKLSSPDFSTPALWDWVTELRAQLRSGQNVWEDFNVVFSDPRFALFVVRGGLQGQGTLKSGTFWEICKDEQSFSESVRGPQISRMRDLPEPVSMVSVCPCIDPVTRRIQASITSMLCTRRNTSHEFLSRMSQALLAHTYYPPGTEPSKEHCEGAVTIIALQSASEEDRAVAGSPRSTEFNDLVTAITPMVCTAVNKLRADPVLSNLSFSTCDQLTFANMLVYLELVED